MAGRMLRELCITKGYPVFLILSDKILAVATTKSSRIVYVYRLEKHKLRFNLSHCRLIQSASADKN